MPASRTEAVPRSVVVAARSMAIGTELTERDVKIVAWPADSPVPGAIANPKEVFNRGLLTAVLENEPITASKVASLETGAGLPPAIPPGMRAISVRVDDVNGVAGFIAPRSRVDLVVTIRRGNDGVTRTVASNVQVLTAGTRREQGRSDGDSRALATTVVTLMVTPADAERIALAQSEGLIMLVLRNPLDHEATVTSGVKTAALMGEAAEAVKAPVEPRPVRRVVKEPAPVVAPPPTPPPARTVEAIRAAKRTEEVIK